VSGLDSLQGGLAVGQTPLCRSDISLHALPSPSKLRQQCLAIGASTLGCGDVCISGVDATLHRGQQTFALRDLPEKGKKTHKSTERRQHGNSGNASHDTGENKHELVHMDTRCECIQSMQRVDRGESPRTALCAATMRLSTSSLDLLTASRRRSSSLTAATQDTTATVSSINIAC
jgi:hypothetical protein